jgi:cell wall-associated NlpC family hydrolase
MNLRTLILCGSIAAPAFSQAAHADLYHVVENGESLASIATRYKSTPDILRAANKLIGINDNAALGAMLLRVPEGSNATVSAMPLIAPTVATSAQAAHSEANRGSNMAGTITRSLKYTVQVGDTVDSIVARHAANGYTVSADSIRDRNNLTTEPTAGQSLVIPVQSTVYRAPGNTVASSSQNSSNGLRTVSSSEQLSGGARLSGEIAMPTAREIPASGSPVYQAPNNRAKKASSNAKPRLAQATAQRGPTSLSSRSYSPSGDTSGVRVLGQQEEAPNLGETPQPRVRTSVPPIKTTAPSRVARVAKISLTGARIRRLPDSDAATLYNCATGTEIAVTRQSGPWSAVLMSDASTGWVPTRYLRMTDQQVDISAIKLQEASLPQRDGKFAYSGNFSSSNPVVANALSYMGTPYVWGGNTRRGIDCSGLVKNAFASAGYSLPRTAAEQAKVGQRVDPSNLREGDRLYFSKSGSRVDHTGMYLNNGLFVHASGSGRSVIVSNLYDKRNWNIFVGARR